MAVGFEFTFTEPEEVPETDAFCEVRKSALLIQGGTHLGQLPLVMRGISAVEIFGDDDLDYGVAEELKALIVVGQAFFNGMGTMRDGFDQKLLVSEFVPDVFQFWQRFFLHERIPEFLVSTIF